jgi:hypothetical protein
VAIGRLRITIGQWLSNVQYGYIGVEFVRGLEPAMSPEEGTLGSLKGEMPFRASKLLGEVHEPHENVDNRLTF